jgi:BASS family bile acid:Na+ symporter
MLTWGFWEYWVAAIQLVLAMIGMGSELTITEFRGILRRPHGIGLVILLQYLCTPLLALGLASAFQLSPGLTLGILMVAALPSGSLSNIFTYLGKGNVPLSITATTASTILCLVLTPLVLRLFQPAGMPGDFHMPAGAILQQIIWCLLLPLATGMAIGHRWRDGRHVVSKWCIRGCLLFLCILIFGSLRSGQLDIFQYGLKEPAVLILFGFALLGPTQLIAIALRFSEDDAFTLGIEVAMRNCNVGMLLKASLWPAAAAIDPMGQGVLYVVLFYGGMSLFLCMVPITRRWLMRRWRASRQSDTQVSGDGATADVALALTDESAARAGDATRSKPRLNRAS